MNNHSLSGEKVTVIGAGLAGCEAAWALANAGVSVTLVEMKPHKYSPAHTSENFAELVCSNSLKSRNLSSAGGLLKAEMRVFGSLLLDCADRVSVAAGGALAVDREEFSALVTNSITSHENITVALEECRNIPSGQVVIATGPLTSDCFAKEIVQLCGSRYLSFFDAAAPIVTLDSLDMGKVFFAARYGKGEADYINCPMDKEQYEQFYEALISAQSAEINEFDKANPKVYEGCMPVEIMAKRGPDTLRFGPLKPVGLTDPNTGRRPWAVVQLRKENSAGSMYNLVGFQTNLKFGEQKRVFSMINGLENAQFVRYGVMHRNTFIDSPRLLDRTFSLKSNPSISFAGQITGVEGYMESAASGILAARGIVRKLKGLPPLELPRESMLGALSAYISDQTVENFQPMGANMGIISPLTDRIKGKQERYLAISERALSCLNSALKQQGELI